MFIKSVSVLLAGLALAGSAAATGSWSLSGDYAPPANPNGPWSYGQVVGGAFSTLAWNAGTGSYGIALPGQTFIYKRTDAGTDYGIASGEVSLESDWGSAAVRWTAPTAGVYAFTIDVGGILAYGPGGYGNNFAGHAGVQVDGLDQAAASFIDASGVKIKSWSFSAVLSAGSTVDTFVLNPGFANGGNTQTKILVSAVPEPASALLLALGAGVLALRHQRRRPGNAAA
jgi:hypothetical protein